MARILGILTSDLSPGELAVWADFMADKTHLRILERGVGAWNEWRRANPTILPDLSAACLNNRNLSGAHLEGGNLERALLRNSTLFGANISCCV